MTPRRPKQWIGNKTSDKDELTTGWSNCAFFAMGPAPFAMPPASAKTLTDF